MPWAEKRKRIAIRAAFLGEPFTLALLYADGSEVADRAYRRQPLDLEQDGPDALRSASEIRFPAYIEDGAQTVASWAIYDAGGDLAAEEAIIEPERPAAGKFAIFPAGEIVIRLRG